MKLDKKIINNAINIEYSYLLGIYPNLEELFINQDPKIMADIETDFIRFEHLGITFE